MSINYSKAIKVNHLNDCVQTGCPGHEVRIAYHNTSDTLSIQIDQESVYFFDPNVFDAAVKARGIDIKEHVSPCAGFRI